MKTEFKRFFTNSRIKIILDDIDMTYVEYRKVYNCLLKMTNINFNEQKIIANFIKYGIDDDYYIRLYKVKKFKHKMTKEHLLMRYGNVEGMKKHNERLEKISQTLTSFISRYGKNKGEERYNKFRENISKHQTKEYYKDKFGIIEGLKKWTVIQKNKDSNSIEYFVKRYGKEEGELLHIKHIKQKSYEGTKEYCKVKHGDNWEEMWKNRYKNGPTKLQYWIEKGYSEEEAKIKLSERQTTFSKKKCIEKHGEIEGIRIWKERQDKWQNTMKSKTPEEIKRINLLKKPKTYSSYFISKAEVELKEILNCESQFMIETDTSFYLYDLKKGNKIIEYNGDYWHCNPDVYSEDYFNEKLKMTSKEKWLKDKEKNNHARSNGYEVMVIWEKNYKKNKEKIIEQCKEFMNEEN